MGEGFLSDTEEEEEEPDEVVVEGGEVESSTEAPAPAPSHEPENSLLTPVEDIDRVVEVYDQFEEIKAKLLDDPDTTKIGQNIHVNKSGWRKIATAFNVSVETIEDTKFEEGGILHFKVKARATAPNGKAATGVGMCSSNESNFMEVVAKGDMDRDEAEKRADNPDNMLKVDGNWRELKDPREVNQHNLYATAATRAKNRAISDLVGGGEVSAEEISADDVL